MTNEDTELPGRSGSALERPVMAPTDAGSVWRIRGELDKARREHMRAVMAEYDKGHNAKMRELREACGNLTGHKWRFSHLGPVGHGWYYCTHCGTSKVEAP